MPDLPPDLDAGRIVDHHQRILWRSADVMLAVLALAWIAGDVAWAGPTIVAIAALIGAIVFVGPAVMIVFAVAAVGAMPGGRGRIAPAGVRRTYRLLVREQLGGLAALTLFAGVLLGPALVLGTAPGDGAARGDAAADLVDVVLGVSIVVAGALGLRYNRNLALPAMLAGDPAGPPTWAPDALRLAVSGGGAGAFLVALGAGGLIVPAMPMVAIMVPAAWVTVSFQVAVVAAWRAATRGTGPF